jgi:hypothetical protein
MRSRIVETVHVLAFLRCVVTFETVSSCQRSSFLHDNQICVYRLLHPFGTFGAVQIHYSSRLTNKNQPQQREKRLELTLNTLTNDTGAKLYVGLEVRSQQNRH